MGYYQICLYLVLKKWQKGCFLVGSKILGPWNAVYLDFAQLCIVQQDTKCQNCSNWWSLLPVRKFLFTACSGLVSSETGFDLNHRSLACFTNHHHRHGRCHSFWPRTTNWVAQVSGQRDWKWSTEQAFSGFSCPRGPWQWHALPRRRCPLLSG